MKRGFRKGEVLVEKMHPYPFFILLLFLYGAIFAFLICGIVIWYPQILSQSHQADYIAEQWFAVGNTLLGVGGVTAPVMDLILHKDT